MLTSKGGWVLSLALLALPACGGGDPSGPSTGSLAVSVSGLPGGASADVLVTGPVGFTRSVDSSETLSNLSPGNYTLTASAVSAGGSFYAADPDSQVVVVSEGSAPASASVTYRVSGGSLAVNISGLPNGNTAAVNVTGPGGYNRAVTTSETLTGLAAGSYTVAAQPVSAGCSVYDPTPTSQTSAVLDAASASANVSYASSSTAGGLNLCIQGMYLTQSVQSFTGGVPLVKDKNGFLRVFVVANQLNAAAPTVRVRFYSGGNLIQTSTINAPSLMTPQAPSEGSLASSWNLSVPGSLIQPNLSILADVDPSNSIAEADEADNNFPASGTPAPLSVRTTSTFNVRFVPVRQSANGSVGNVTTANKDQYLAQTLKMHPISSVSSDVRATAYTTTTKAAVTSDNSNNAWTTILSELNALRVSEGGSLYYYGVVHAGYSNGVAGIGYVGLPTAIGWDNLPSASGVAAHEWGHNWGREHAPCGGASNPDINFPYSGGYIGVYGYDVEAGQLKSPSTSHDLMGYCDNEWISNYTYTGVLSYRSTHTDVASGISQEAMQPCLLVWGRIERGQLVLEPAFQINTRPQLPKAAGAYSVEARAGDGSSIFHLSFSPEAVADDPNGDRQFAFAVPLSEARAARVTSLQFAGQGRSVSWAPLAAAPAQVQVHRGADGRAALSWDAGKTPMILVRDAASGEILSFARGGQAEVWTRRPELALTLSNRIQSREVRVSVPTR
jgi:CARDB